MSRGLMMGLGGLLLESLLLFRGIAACQARRYYFFYIYIASVMIASVVLVIALAIDPKLYHESYWPLQFGTLVTGYGILLEILNHVLAPYPGAEKFARFSGLMAFAAILCFALIAPRIFPQQSPGTVIEFERDLRSIQAIFVFVLLAVIFYYGIPIGRNMKGMIMGYGLYVLTSLMSLAVRAYAGASFDRVWDVVQPLSYDGSLAIWLVALWSYCPNPSPDPNISLEEDYEALASKTKSVIGAIRNYLRKAARA